MPLRILLQYYDFYKSLPRYGISIYSATPKEIIDWHDFHKHLISDYSRVVDINTLDNDQLLELKQIFDINKDFQVSFFHFV